MSGFDIAHEIVVDSDVPDLAPVLFLPLPDFDPPDEPQEGGTVKFLKLGIIADDGQLFVGGLLILLCDLQLGGELCLLFQPRCFQKISARGGGEKRRNGA